MRASEVMKIAAGWWAVGLVVVLGSLPWAGPAIVWVLRTFLEALSNFGAPA